MKNNLTLLLLVIVLGFIECVHFSGCSTKELTTEELVWPSPPDQPRVRYIGEWKDDKRLSSSFTENFFSALVGSSSPKHLVKPQDVAVDREGRIYVTDTGIGAVVVFDTLEQTSYLLGVKGQGQLSQPLGITVANKYIFVTDGNQKKVFGYDKKGILKIALGKEKEFERPTGIAFDDSTQRLYIVDTHTHCVRVYSLHGKFLFSFGKRGKEKGEFNYPINITVRNGKVYVVDTMNFRVQIFDLNGTFLSMFGSIGAVPGTLARPKGISVSSDGKIFIADAAFNNFQIFDEEGHVYLAVGEAGDTEGTFQLPTGMCITGNNDLYVVDQLNGRIQVFHYFAEK